jgi:CxxC motif-containing protein
MIQKELVCVNCPMGCRVTVELENDQVVSVSGNSCPRGREYAIKECIRPERILTSTVRVNGGVHRVLPVITSKEIPLDQIFDAMEIIKKTEVNAPVHEGDVIICDILNSGADVIASRSMKAIN